MPSLKVMTEGMNKTANEKAMHIFKSQIANREYKFMRRQTNLSYGKSIPDIMSIYLYLKMYPPARYA